MRSYDEDVAHVTRGPREVPPSAVCEPGHQGTHHVTLPESGGLRTRGADGVSPGLRTGQDTRHLPSAVRRQKGVHLSFLCL